MTIAALQEQLDKLAAEHPSDIEQQNIARRAAQIAEGRHELGQIDDAALDAATQTLDSASRLVSRKSSAMEALKADIAADAERERSERRGTFASEADVLAPRRSKVLRAIAKHLSTVESDFGELDDIDADLHGFRRAIIELRDVDAEEATIRQRWRDRREELKREAAALDGLEPNWPSLDFREEQEVRALREAAQVEAQALAPNADADELAAIIDNYADLLPRLMDSRTREVFATALEFLQGPLPARGVEDHVYVGETTRKLFGSDDFPAARTRFDESRALLERLAAPRSRGDDRHRTVHEVAH